MPGGKTKFNESWLECEDENKVKIKTWCVKGRDDFEAYCRLCKSYIKVGNSGKHQILSHASTDKHSKYSKSAKSSHTISDFNNPTSSDNLNLEQQVLKAEILWCLKVAEADFSFSSSKNIKEIFSLMFTDSDIAKKFQMSDRKLSYVVSYGLGKYFQAELIEDVKKSIKNPQNIYSLSYDETTTSQIKKQFDMYIRYWSSSSNRIESAYLGSKFLGHAQAETLKNKIIEAINEKGLPLTKLLMLSVDGPNVNKSTLKRINEELMKEGASELVDVGTCPLHIVHNAFALGMSTLNLNIDEFATDIYGFFKSSAARREDLKDIQDELELQNNNFLRHVSSRWLTLEPVVKRIIEQFTALKEYFVDLSKHGDKDITNNARFIRLRNKLTDCCTLPYLHFILKVAPIFTEFLTLFQTEAPVIHLLNPKMNDLLINILRKFMKNEFILNKHDEELKNLDITKSESHISIKKIDIGMATRSTLSSAPETETKRILYNMKESYIKMSQYLKKKLPFDNEILKDVQFLNPCMRNSPWIDNAIPRLCRKLKNLRLNNDDIEKIMQEWKTFKLETLSEDLYIIKDYLKDGVRFIEYERNDVFWSKVFTIVDLTGHAKYSNLAKLVKSCLTLMHGNADVERGFSKNKLVLGVDRCSLGEKTIVGLRLIKDKLHRSDNNINNIIITPSMIRSVKEARCSYHAELEKEKKLAEESEQLKQKAKEEESQKKNDLKRKNIIESELKDLCKKETFLKQEIDRNQELIQEATEKLSKAIETKSMKEISNSNAILHGASTKLQAHTKQLNEVQLEIKKMNSELNLITSKRKK